MATRAQLEQYAKNPNVRKFLDLISYTEGTQGNGYRTAFGGGRLSSLNDHPRYSKSFKQLNGKTNTTSAAGRYQFLKSTWDGVARQYGLRDFSPHSQDLGAIALLIGRGALAPLLKGDWQTAVRKSGREWASLPTAPASYSQPTKSWAKVNQFMTGKAGGSPSQRYQDEPQQPRYQRAPLLSMADIQAQAPYERPPLIDLADVAPTESAFMRAPMIDLADIDSTQMSFERAPLIDPSDVLVNSNDSLQVEPPIGGDDLSTPYERAPMLSLDDVMGMDNNIEPKEWQMNG